MANKSQPPKYVYICGVRWSITYHKEDVVYENNMLQGLTDRANRTIKIDAKLPLDGVKSTLLHEVIHAIISTTLNTYPDEEEPLVQAMEVGWCSVINDPRNNSFLSYIFNHL